MNIAHSYSIFRSPLAAAALAVALGAGMISPAEGATTLGTLDISGIEVTPPATVTRQVTLGAGTVTSVFFDFTVTHTAPSWLSETAIIITAPDATIWAFGATGESFGFATEPGTDSFFGSFDIGSVAAEGTWTFVFSDSYVDMVSPNYTIAEGSSIELRGQGGVAVIPLPGGLPLLLGGLGALALVRKRMARAG